MESYILFRHKPNRYNGDGIPVIYEYLRILREYVEKNVRFWRMRPANELVESKGLTCTLAAEDEEYLIYFVNGGSVKLNVPKGTYRLLDPRNGKIVQEGCCEAGAFKFDAPASDNENDTDWVLHIKAEGFDC